MTESRSSEGRQPQRPQGQPTTAAQETRPQGEQTDQVNEVHEVDTANTSPTAARTSTAEDDKALETQDSASEHPKLKKVATAASALLRPLDLADRPAPPPHALDASSTASDPEKDSESLSEELTAYQYGDGRVKIE
ncbi:hypothetical protein KEM55_006836, partial [Ascosphaera atra]